MLQLVVGTVSDKLALFSDSMKVRFAGVQVATYSYDALNRLKALLYSDETITYTYDDTATSANSKGRLSKVADGSGSTTYAYDARGRITTKSQVTGSATLTVQYGYNAAGQLASITTPGGNAIAYGYLNNQVVSVTVNGTPVVTNAKYFPFGGVASWTWGNGQGYQRTYDQDGRIQSVTIAGKVRAYGFDPASRITSLTDTQGTTSTPTTIAYDNLDRLTSAQGNVPGGFDLGYGYDLIGNRTGETKTAGSTPQSRAYSYEMTSNRLTALTNPAIAYGYDAAGNTTADGAATYTYSGRNRLVTVTQGSSTIASYEYNALGQRVAKTTSATTLFAYDEAGHLLGEYDGAGAMSQETVWLNDTPVATLRKSGTSNAIHYVWADHLDTPRAITTSDAASTLEWGWDSDPFGTTAPQEIALGYNLRFPGQYFDAETGKYYNYYRDYDSTTGRYVESDPVGLRGGLNTYAYVSANPLALLDMLGLTAADVQGVGRDVGASFVDLHPNRFRIDFQPMKPGEDGATDNSDGQTYVDPSWASKACFTRSEYQNLFFTIFHEYMHSSDPLWRRLLTSNSPDDAHHNSIYQRELYERHRWRNKPDNMWGTAREYPLDMDRLYKGYRKRTPACNCGGQ